MKRYIVVGAGLSGLTAAAYLLKEGQEVMLLEKNPVPGGLVSSFGKEGFLFDTGPRALGDGGILKPMIVDLGLDLDLIKGDVSTGIDNEIVHHDSSTGVRDYIDSLARIFPDNRKELARLKRLILRYSRMTRTLGRVPNPLFRNPVSDLSYLFTRFLPWLPTFLDVLIKTGLNSRSIEEEMGRITENQSLNDMVCQHYFKGTPAPFGFGYFQNFRDYWYPRGGTNMLPTRLEEKILSLDGTILYNREVVKISAAKRELTDQTGEIHGYDGLVWAGDLKSLYSRTDPSGLKSACERHFEREKQTFLSALPGESVFTLFLAVDLPPEFFKKISRGHFIFTPDSRGLGDLRYRSLKKLKTDFNPTSKDSLFRWVEEFCRLNSYEISIPVLKDPSLAPEGKTGLVVSFLLDGELYNLVERAGWGEEFRENMANLMVDVLSGSIYSGLKEKILFKRTATPSTLRRMFLTDNGAITGWSLEKKPPVPDSLTGIFSSSKTALPAVWKAGQWTYSPSGVPIALLTGRIAASAALKGRL